MESVPSQVAKMKIKAISLKKRAFSGLEKILREASRKRATSCDKGQLNKTRILVEQIITNLVRAMVEQSSTFSKLYVKNFGVGSVYERTKIGKPNEFDIDLVLRIPEMVKPVLRGEAPGFVQVQLQNFEHLAKTDKIMYKALRKFVDDENYMLSQNMMTMFVHQILQDARSNYFPDDIIRIGDKAYKICKIDYIEPALTLTIKGPDLFASVDLVASFLLDEEFWSQTNSRKNPCPSEKNFFLAPARPIEDLSHKERFWRPSFHLQERQIMTNRQWAKPALRALKKIRDYFEQSVHSYAIKTLFLWELYSDNPNFDKDTPIFWKSSLSGVVVYMLEKYLKCLGEKNIPCFWNSHLNLLCYLTDEEMEEYQENVAEVLDRIKNNFDEKIVAEYFK